MRVFRLLGLLCLLTSLLSGALIGAGPAAAQSPEDQAFAQRHFERGVALYDQGAHAEALASFEASLEIIPSPNSALYVARCLRALGRPAAAAEMYAQVTSLARLSGEAERYAQTAEAADAERARLEGDLGHVVLQGELSEDATIAIGARSYRRVALGLPIPVEPGRVQIAVSSGGESWEQVVEVAARREVQVTLAPSAAEPGDAPQTPPALDPAPGSETEAETEAETGAESSQGFPGWALAGTLAGAAVAGVGVGLAVGFGVAADNRFAELDAACGTSPCPPALQDSVDEGQRYQTLANVGIGLLISGAVAATAFVVFGLLSGEDGEDQRVALDRHGRLRF